MFDGFQLERVDVGEVTLRVRYGGTGEPVVLLHGHPRTHTTWHRVASRLAQTFFVVCPDLRGYGQSTLPPDAPGHAQSSKRAMAGDVAVLMRHLGRDRFSVVGHDRGALVASRAAMDYRAAVERLVVMDSLPVTEHLERLNEAFVRTWWHWWFLGQTEKPAEAFISADPGRWYRTPPSAQMGAGNHADVWAAFRDPAVVHGMREDCRAGLRVDRAHEEATGPRAGRSHARYCCSSQPTTTSTSTATPRASGGPGRSVTCAAASSIPGTTRPKKRQKRSLRHFCSSSGRKVSAGPWLALAAAGPRPPGRAAGEGRGESVSSTGRGVAGVRSQVR
ncbi:MAG: alpha/beta fold hydrolase [Trebonia sp.]